MKVLARTVSLVILASAVVLMSNCGGDDPEKSKEEIQFNKLKKEWAILTPTNGATLSSGGAPTDRTPEFSGFKLNISGTFNANSPNGPYPFTVSGSRPTPSPWPASGTITFAGLGSGDSGSLIRKDQSGGNDLPMTYSINSNGQLTLEFICIDCSYAGGRIEAVNGTWTFRFN